MEYSKWISIKLDYWWNDFRTYEIYWELSSQSACQCNVLILYLFSLQHFGCHRKCTQSDISGDFADFM
jgi:hypothetical protein